VHAGRFDVGVRDIFGRQPFAEVAVDFDQAIFGAAGDPQQLDLRIGPGIKIGELLVEVRREAAGTECTNVCELVERVQAGEQDAELLGALMAAMIDEAPECKVDYATVVDPGSFQTLKRIEREALGLLAVQVGKTRLIDNMLLTSEQASA